MKVKSIKTRDIIKLYEKQKNIFDKTLKSEDPYQIDRQFNILYGIQLALQLAGYNTEDLS